MLALTIKFHVIMKHFLFGITIMCFFLLCSCTEKKTKLSTVSIDLNNCKPIDIHSSSCKEKIVLETTKESLLSNIKNIFIKGDTMLIFSVGKVSAFDNKGSFLFNIGAKGRAENEYISLKSFFIKKGIFFLHDWDNRKLLKFSSNNNFIEKIDLEKDGWMPDFIFPFKDSLYVVKNTYGGEQTKVPLISIYDNNFKILSSSTKILKNGSSLSDLFFPYKNEVLYWEILCDTIYSISQRAEIVPKYFVDFGSNRVPDTINGSDDLYTRIEYINRPENKDRYAIMAGNVREDDKYLYFSFVYGYGVIHIARYNKEKNKTDLFRLINSENGKNITFTYMTVLNGDVIIASEADSNNEDNPVLYRITL